MTMQTFDKITINGVEYTGHATIKRTREPSAERVGPLHAASVTIQMSADGLSGWADFATLVRAVELQGVLGRLLDWRKRGPFDFLLRGRSDIPAPLQTPAKLRRRLARARAMLRGLTNASAVAAAEDALAAVVRWNESQAALAEMRRAFNTELAERIQAALGAMPSTTIADDDGAFTPADMKRTVARVADEWAARPARPPMDVRRCPKCGASAFYYSGAADSCYACDEPIAEAESA